MATTTWRGESGERYKYTVELIAERPKTNKEGNYIFARKVLNVWYAVYVGEGKLRDRYDAAIEEECVTDKNATHYHWHLNDSRSARRDEEADIIEGNDECKAPRGCNGQGP